MGKNCVEAYPGWPGKIVGGGKARWRRGAPTDDTEMALSILRAVANERGGFSPLEITRHFLAWLDTNPKDVGGTTRRTLFLCKRGAAQTAAAAAAASAGEGGAPVAGDADAGVEQTKAKAKATIAPFAGGEWDFDRNPGNGANGSLMRNGVVAAIYADEGEAAEARLIDYTVLHGIITHYAPLPVITCVVHSLLIRGALLKGARGETLTPPTIEDLEELLAGPWAKWKRSTADPEALKWLKRVGASEMMKAERTLLTELRGFERFQPYTQDYRNRSGYCVLTLQISLWALYWSFQSTHPEIPEWLPEWPFLQHGFDTLMWVVLVGADADTYGATAGPLLAAYHPTIKAQFLDGLQVRPLIKQYMAQIETDLRPPTPNK